jgi:hypothetical protein
VEVERVDVSWRDFNDFEAVFTPSKAVFSLSETETPQKNFQMNKKLLQPISTSREKM